MSALQPLPASHNQLHSCWKDLQLSGLTAFFDGQELLYYVELSSAGKGKKFGGCLVQQRKWKSISLMLEECRKQIHMLAKWSNNESASNQLHTKQSLHWNSHLGALLFVLHIWVPAGSHTAEWQSKEYSLCHFPTCEVTDACNIAAHTVASANSAHAWCNTLQAETQCKATSRSPITTDDLREEKGNTTPFHTQQLNGVGFHTCTASHSGLTISDEL